MSEAHADDISFNDSNIVAMIKNIETKILNRVSKGDKESLRKALVSYTQLYNTKKLDPSYLLFHFNNVTSNSCPDYLIPEIFDEIRNDFDCKLSAYTRDEKRDSDLMKLAGCKYYSRVFKDIENFIFYKCNQDNYVRVPEYRKATIAQTPLPHELIESIKEKWKTVDLKNQDQLTQLFQPILIYYPLTSSIIAFELKGKVYIFTFQYMAFKSGNKKYIMRTSSNFDISTPDDDSPFILLPGIDENEFNFTYTNDDNNNAISWDMIYDLSFY